MLKLLGLFGLVTTTYISHATPVEDGKRQDCDAFLRELFRVSDASATPTLAERLKLTPLALEIYQDDYRRCSTCLPMGYSAGILDRIPPGQFAQVFFHDLPEFRTTDREALRAAFRAGLRSLGNLGHLILTLNTPTDWDVFKAQIEVGREFGLEVQTLLLADFDLSGTSFYKH